MVFKLLSTGRGVPLSLASERATPLKIELEGAPKDTSFWIKNGNGAVNYYTVKDGVCELNISTFGGNISAGAISPSKAMRWDCGTLCVYQTPRGLFAAPSVTDVSEQVRSVLIENEEIRENNKRISKRIEELEAKLNDFYEGYDVI